MSNEGVGALGGAIAGIEAVKKMEEEKKKKEEERMKKLQISYILHTACILCSEAVRESYVVVPKSHGEFIQNGAQLNVSDSIPNVNVLSFGVCRSAKNPNVQAAARKVIKDVKNREGRSFSEKVLDFFTPDSDEEEELAEGKDSLIQYCAGKCEPVFDTEWIDGEESVLVDGKPALLGRCKLKCIYGGEITFYTSGQPE